MQALGGFLDDHGRDRRAQPLVACCKGIDLATLRGPVALIAARLPGGAGGDPDRPQLCRRYRAGPADGADAGGDERMARRCRSCCRPPTLRLYRTDDVRGAELGGALKNVIAIAAGIVIGAGLGDSARAALMTRGYAEMVRLALALGARAETLAGLSGFGDLVLTCTSAQSRNFRFGLALGRGEAFDPQVTVEGVATARAVAAAGGEHGDRHAGDGDGRRPCRMGGSPLNDAIGQLMSRPLKQE